MKYSVTSSFLCLIIGSFAYADQVIYIDMADFILGISDFGVEVDGNEWVEVADPDALDGQAFGGPGDNNRNDANPVGAPFLVYRFPVKVKAGESTADGKKWIPWVRMRVPGEQNSFWWQVGPVKGNWKPKTNTNANRWNDDGRNSSDEWYWQDHITGNAEGIPADIAVGSNYFRIGIRESDPVTFPTIDVVCFRNDGGTPNVDEAADFLEEHPIGSRISVEPANKLSASWGQLKNIY